MHRIPSSKAIICITWRLRDPVGVFAARSIEAPSHILALFGCLLALLGEFLRRSLEVVLKIVVEALLMIQSVIQSVKTPFLLLLHSSSSSNDDGEKEKKRLVEFYLQHPRDSAPPDRIRIQQNRHLDTACRLLGSRCRRGNGPCQYIHRRTRHPGYSDRSDVCRVGMPLLQSPQKRGRELWTAALSLSLSLEEGERVVILKLGMNVNGKNRGSGYIC